MATPWSDTGNTDNIGEGWVSAAVRMHHSRNPWCDGGAGKKSSVAPEPSAPPCHMVSWFYRNRTPGVPYGWIARLLPDAPEDAGSHFGNSEISQLRIAFTVARVVKFLVHDPRLGLGDLLGENRGAR